MKKQEPKSRAGELGYTDLSSRVRSRRDFVVKPTLL